MLEQEIYFQLPLFSFLVWIFHVRSDSQIQDTMQDI